MKVNVDGRNVTISLEADDASRLADVLALVNDRSSAQSMDTLYNLLVDNGVVEAGAAAIEHNPDFDPTDDNNSEFWVVSF